MSFATVAQIYEKTPQVSIYMVYPSVEKVAGMASALSELRRLVASGEEDLQEMLDAVNFALYRVASNTLPPNHEALGLADLLNVIKSSQAELDPRTRAHAAAELASTTLDALITQEMTALTSEVISVLDTASPEDRLLVLARSRNLRATEDFFREIEMGTRVVSAKQLRSKPSSEVVVCVGSPNLFPAAVWNASWADSVCFVTYPFGRQSLPSGGLFGDEGGLKTTQFRENGFSQRIEDVVVVSPEEAYYLEAGKRLLRNVHSAGSETVSAQLLLLQGGYAAWMSVGEADWMWAIEFIDEYPTIRQVTPSDMDTGAYVIFRDQGAATELIRSVADRDCGAWRFRPIQERWKAELAKSIAHAGGARAAADQIKRLGAHTANPALWIEDRSIRPHDQRDLRAACEFAGLQSESDTIWSALTEIKRAHQRAGQLIRKELEKALIADGGERLDADGLLRLDVDGLGRLSAYRVLFKHPETNLVPRDDVDRPFIAEERGWPE